MFELKPIGRDTVPRALEKAERYRLLNEPEEAESICLDILTVDAENQEARVMLFLALTDQFGSDDGADCVVRAQELLPLLRGDYERCYYAGILCERRGSARLGRGGHGACDVAYSHLCEAMEWYEKAEALRPPHNDDAVLRWNTCARMIAKHRLTPAPGEMFEPALLE